LPPIATTNYLGLVDDEPIAHMAVSSRFEIGGAVRPCRLVSLTAWQGTGVDVGFLNAVCAA